MLGIGGTSIDLLTRGFANNADFGGAGPVTLTSLGALGVWATLLPSSLTPTVDAKVMLGSELITNSLANMGNDDLFYLVSTAEPGIPVPEPGTLAVFGFGLGVGYVIRRRKTKR